MKIFSGTSNLPLTKKICERLNMEIGKVYLHEFPSKEKYCQYQESIRGEDIFLVQSGSTPVNDNLMELLIMADTARRASAKSITAVCPVFPYQRQERKDKPRVPISAKLVMDLFENSGINRLLTLDLHAPQIQGFSSNLPIDQLSFRPALVNSLKNKEIRCVVAPDIGAVKRAEEYANVLGVELSIISKKRNSETSVELQHFIGDVKNKNVIIIDDMTESGGTLIQAAKACKEQGASKVNCAVTHGCFTDIGILRLIDSFKEGLIEKLYVSNSVNYLNGWIDQYEITGLEEYAKKWDFFHVVQVDVSSWFATAIRNITNNESVTELFK